jgi:mannose-1-phosphate guanylyltransferase
MSGGVGTAFVLGAGLGTRLRPLTNERPKPLVPIFHKPLITFAFDHLKGVGVQRFVVNTHHCPDAYERLLGASDGSAIYRGHAVSLRHEPVLLDTGGGIRNVEDLLNDGDFLVHNGDVLADLPLSLLLEEHSRSGNIATLGLRSAGGPTHIQFDPWTRRVTDIRGAIGRCHDPSFLFTGIYVLSPEIFRFLPPQGKIHSIITTFLQLIKTSGKIGGVVLDEGIWFDLGTRQSYLEAHRLFGGTGTRLSYALDGEWPRAIHPTAFVGEEAELTGVCAIGPGAKVGAGAKLRDCILWENAEIREGACLETCIVRDGRHGGGVLRDADI